MRAIWTGAVDQPFVVRDVHQFMPELAYTTVMTTLNRLVDKGLLSVTAVRRQRAHPYRCLASPEEFLITASRDQVAQIVEQFGDAAIAAFAEHVGTLNPEHRRRLLELTEQ
jgi:predicted transcriptional regulator